MRRELTRRGLVRWSRRWMSRGLFRPRRIKLAFRIDPSVGFRDRHQYKRKRDKAGRTQFHFRSDGREGEKQRYRTFCIQNLSAGDDLSGFSMVFRVYSRETRKIFMKKKKKLNEGKLIGVLYSLLIRRTP